MTRLPVVTSNVGVRTPPPTALSGNPLKPQHNTKGFDEMKETIDLGFSGYDELFMTDAQRAEARQPKIREIPLREISPFREHPFKVKQDEEMEQLKESIRASGVLVPALVRPKDDGGYEMISGHRRLEACRALGFATMPVIVRDLTDEEAVIAMVDANLQRERILPSEKAFAYKMKYEALKHQGTSSQIGTKLRTDELMAKDSGESRNQIQRYIRLTNLIPELLGLMDEGRIALSVGVELSYLNPQLQKSLAELIDRDEQTPSYSQAVRMHKMSAILTRERTEEIMGEEKPNQRDTYRIRADRLRRLLPAGCTPEKAEEYILKACEYYQRYLRRMRDQERG